MAAREIVLAAAAIGLSLLVTASCQPASAEPPLPKSTERPDKVAEAPKSAAARIQFTSLAVDYRAPLAHMQPQHLRISADGECAYSIDGRDAERNHPALPAARQKFRVPAERMLALQALLEKTNWLQAPGGAGPALHTDADETAITVVRGEKSHTVTCEGERPEPYLSLSGWIDGLLAQEYRLYRLTALDARERREACRTLSSELSALLGTPGQMFPIFEFDYARYLPTLLESLHNPKEATSEELAAAIALVTYLRVDAEFETIAGLKHNQYARRAVIRSLVHFGGERAAKALAEMGSGEPEMLWGLICLQEVANEELVRLARSSPENVVRAYIDHWDELPGPPDQRIADAAGKALKEVVDRGGRRTYYQEYLRLCAEEQPPAPGLSAQLNYLLVQRRESSRFVHGWYVVADDKIVAERRLPAPEPGTTPFFLVFSAVAEGAELKIHGGWRPAQRGYGDKPNIEFTEDGEVKLPADAKLEVIYQWGKKRRDHSNGDPSHVRVPSHLRTLYDALVVQDGKTVMRIVYVARVAEPDADPKALWSPSAPGPSRTEPSER